MTLFFCLLFFFSIPVIEKKKKRTTCITKKPKENRRREKKLDVFCLPNALYRNQHEVTYRHPIFFLTFIPTSNILLQQTIQYNLPEVQKRVVLPEKKYLIKIIINYIFVSLLINWFTCQNIFSFKFPINLSMSSNVILRIPSTTHMRRGRVCIFADYTKIKLLHN